MRGKTQIHSLFLPPPSLSPPPPPSLPTSGGKVGFSEVSELLVDPTDNEEYDLLIKASSGCQVRGGEGGREGEGREVGRGGEWREGGGDREEVKEGEGG